MPKSLSIPSGKIIFAPIFKKTEVSMDAFIPYSLPIQGLKTGLHQFEYQLDNEFFALFEDTPISVVSVEAKVYMDRRPSMLVFDFIFQGKAQVECDICLADIFVPVEGSHRLYVKFNEEAAVSTDNDDDVIFISPKAPEFNLAVYLYEFSVLSLPFANRIEDCELEEVPPCNFDTLDKLKAEDEESDEPKTSVWDALKGFNLDN